jgi:hypothetical protein
MMSTWSKLISVLENPVQNAYTSRFFGFFNLMEKRISRGES